MPLLEEDLIQTGQVKYVVRDFPLASHEHAVQAAEAAHCAGDQDLFFPMYRAIFQNYDEVSREALSTRARNVGVDDLDAFETCLEQRKYAPFVRTDSLEAAKAGVESTPTFLIGYTDPVDPAGGPVRILKKLEGLQSYQAFRHAVQTFLEESSP